MVDKRLKKLLIIKIAVVAVVLILIFGGFELIQQHFEQQSESVACIQVFDPVCTIGGVTFPNQCEADVAGARTLYKGQCP